MTMTGNVSDAIRYQHRVVTGIDEMDHTKRLYVQKYPHDNSVNYACLAFRPNPEAGWSTIRSKTCCSPRLVIEELGWHSDPDALADLVRRVSTPYVQRSPQQDEKEHENNVFQAWIGDVIYALNQNHSPSYWQRNTFGGFGEPENM